jgi:hypothetical protein
MHKTTAIIRKVGTEFCVFSHDGKNLGCSNSRKGAEKRLQQVEYFKHKGSSGMNYKDAFDNFAKALNEGFTPDEIGKAPDAAPRKVEVESETLSVADRLSTGTIAGYPSANLLDKKEHFPVITHTQAQSSMARVMQLTDVPAWYRGTLPELRQEVYAGIMKLHPDIELNVRVSAEMAVALSDGQTPAETSKTSVKDPADVAKKEVPSVPRPSLTSAQIQEALADEETRKAVASSLIEAIDKQLDGLKTAKKLAGRLGETGLDGAEFDQLSVYLQEDILYSLMSRGVKASGSESRRQELLNKLTKKQD